MGKSIIICTVPRTGSSVLCAHIRSTSAMGNPREYLGHRRGMLGRRWDVDPHDFDAYLDEVRRRTTTANGVFGVKVFYHQLARLGREGHLEPKSGLLKALAEKLGGEVYAVSLLRRNKLRQAISLVRARQTGQWAGGKASADTDRKPEGQAAYDRAAIASSIVELVREEAAWSREFELSGMRPWPELWFEDFVKDQDDTLLQIAKAAQLPNPETIVKQRDRESIPDRRSSNEEQGIWFDQFLDERGRWK